MLLIPAIDIKNGQCVRLRQGRMDDVTVFDEDPVAVAERWLAEGADRIHVVDLDGAKAGYPVNDRVIGQIVSACGNVPGSSCAARVRSSSWPRSRFGCC